MSYNILIVDDSEIIRTVVKKAVGMSGLDVSGLFEAANGLEALAVLEKEWVDIVLADINMPEMNGIELVTKMSENSMMASVPVIIISSEQNQNKIRELEERGIRAYLRKPFRPEGFRDVVTSILGEQEKADHEQ